MLHELAIHEYTQLAKVGRTIDLEPQVETLVVLAVAIRIAAATKHCPDPGRAATAKVVIYITALGRVTMYGL